MQGCTGIMIFVYYTWLTREMVPCPYLSRVQPTSTGLEPHRYHLSSHVRSHNCLPIEDKYPVEKEG
jgi:hypothetical protein